MITFWNKMTCDVPSGLNHSEFRLFLFTDILRQWAARVEPAS